MIEGSARRWVWQTLAVTALKVSTSGEKVSSPDVFCLRGALTLMDDVLHPQASQPALYAVYLLRSSPRE